MTDADITSQVQAISQRAPERVSLVPKLREQCDSINKSLQRVRRRRASAIPADQDRILVVDDDGPLRRGLVRELKTLHRATVHGAADVASALVQVQDLAYDVLVLDYLLTNGTAFDIAAGAYMVTREQRRLPPHVFLISGYTPELAANAKRIQALMKIDADMIRHFPKPLNLEVLTDAVIGALATRRLRPQPRLFEKPPPDSYQPLRLKGKP